MSKKDSYDDIEYESLEDTPEYAKKLKKLKKELEACRKEKGEYLEGWQRSKADFVNAKRNFEDDKTRLRSLAKEDLINDLFPVIDSFDMAFKDKEAWEKVDQVWRTGVEYIYNHLMETLKNHGLEPYEDLGKPFDPNRHVSAEVVEANKKGDDGKITDVIQKGFMLNNHIVRPARVKVAEYKKS